MSEHDVSAAERALYLRLTESDQIWGDRVYPDYIPANVQRPYVIFTYGGGGERNYTLNSEAMHTFYIRCVSASKAEAREGARLLNDLLNDAERKAPLVSSDDWQIMTVTRREAIEIVEFVDGSPVYHSGNRYELNLERR